MVKLNIKNRNIFDTSDAMGDSTGNGAPLTWRNPGNAAQDSFATNGTSGSNILQFSAVGSVTPAATRTTASDLTGVGSSAKVFSAAPVPQSSSLNQTAATTTDATTDSAATMLNTTSLAAETPPNKIVLENQKQGTPIDSWMVNGDGDGNIQGFATDISTNVGGTVDFKIATDSKHYRIEIYRLGYYGGDGSRLVDTVDKSLTTAQIQPHPIVDMSIGLVDAGNWSVSASWQIPQDATSGLYVAKLVREDGTAGESIIPFVVRDDSSTSDIVFQTSDTTWQAYNAWGGASLYYGEVPVDPADMIGYMPPNCSCGLTAIGRASAVSYNRPIITNTSPYGGSHDYITGGELPAIEWLEQNGYDVSYISGVDSSRAGTLLMNHDAFLSVGHDEYWSGEQRANVEAARDAGVNLAFWSGNEVYWKVRWETSIDGNGTPYRTMVCYKETWGTSTDPSSTSTGTWRDPRFADPGQEPENSLTGTLFTVDSYRSDTMSVPYDYSNLRFWRDTDIADLQPDQTYHMPEGILGYEWDSDVENGFRPAGLIDLSLSTVSVDTYLRDYGTSVGTADVSHSLTMYRAESGALVFSAGTVFWSWGLNDDHDGAEVPTDKNIQQAMVNMFADMGIQPTTLDASLILATESTDHTKPTSTITSPSVGAHFVEGQHVTVTGTAQDFGGGIIAGVEISVDGGAHWFKATGRENWSYNWVVQASGTYTIMSRAVDDSLNLETPSAGKQVTIDLPSTSSLWTLSSTPQEETVMDRDSVELGVKFQTTVGGEIEGIRFYKGFYNTGAHTVSLWTANGTLLATGTSTGESLSGWQTVTFSSPVHVTAGTTYVASYHTAGYYSTNDNYFANPYSNGLVKAVDGGGVFAYSDTSTFPGNNTGGSNYWVDVVFDAGPNTVPVATDDSGFTVGRDGTLTLSLASLVANDTDANGDTLTISAVGNGVNGTVTLDTQTGNVIFKPTAGYFGPASFTYTVSDGRGGTDQGSVSLTVNEGPAGVSLFQPNETPTGAANHDNASLELGMKFVASTSGVVTGIRFYKASGDAGTHTGSIWTSTGTLLGTVTFTSESLSGWQTATFSSPIQLTAGTTYVASYHTTSGTYYGDAAYFNTAHTNGALTAPSSSTSGGNGVYATGSNTIFPTSSYNATNYWVDVVFNQSTTNTVPIAANDNGYNANFNLPLVIAASSVLANDIDADGDTLTVTGADNATNGTVSYNAQTNSITFTPTAGYTGPASFRYSISDGRGGTATAQVSLTVNPEAPNTVPVANADNGFSTTAGTPLVVPASALLDNDTDANGDPLTITGADNAANGTVSYNAQTNSITFTPTAGYTGPASFRYSISDGRGGTASAQVSLTVGQAATTTSLFSPTDTPAIPSDSDTAPVELGVKFVASASGQITGMRYYKSAQDTGTHVGSLWTSTGALLATATFTNETASGWQTVTFAQPVSIAAGTTYVASYQSNGHYAATSNYFTTAHTNGALSAPAGSNGVYAYGSGNEFPTLSYGSTNYWVDVLYQQIVPPNNAPVANADNGFGTIAGTPVVIQASALLANDTDADSDTLTVTGADNATNGTVSYNAQNNTVTFTPTAGYTGTASFRYSISDGRGGTSSAQVSLTVNPEPPNTAPVANADSGFSTTTGTPVVIQASALLANDSDANGDTLTVTGADNATNGTVSYNAQTNAITFTPTAGYTGTAGFRYSISDGRGGTASAQVSLSVDADNPTQTVFAANATPTTLSVSDNPVNLGMKFQADVAGSITGFRFYKSANNTGPHTGYLWTSTGTLLASATFTNESASGWQSVNLTNSVSIQADTTYVVSYSTNGNYSASANFFNSETTSGNLHALSSALSGGNGVYAYGTAGMFPTGSYNSTNYYVDVAFRPQLAA